MPVMGQPRTSLGWCTSVASNRTFRCSISLHKPDGTLYEAIYYARGETESRIKECQVDLFADRISAATTRANQLRLWFAAMAYVLLCALRRVGLAHTQFAEATCGTIRLNAAETRCPGAYQRATHQVRHGFSLSLAR
jgi:hypothetical protein